MEKKGQQFLLISKQKSLQNIAQSFAKDLHPNIDLPLQYGPFSRNNPCKRQENFSAYFLTKIHTKYPSNFCKRPACKH